jgi:dethiobiotin synthetase
VCQNKKLFITGISTDVGKTVASAINVEVLEAAYCKSIQAWDVVDLSIILKLNHRSLMMQ